MLTDISGNTYLTVNNNQITTIFTPPQLFNSGLTIWWDFNDRSVLYNSTALTTNVQMGDIIYYVVNKAPNRPFYDLRNVNFGFPTRYGIPLPSANTGVFSVFCANTLNTNKNTHFYTGPNPSNSAVSLASLSGYSSSGKTAFTYSVFCRLPTNGTDRIVTSIFHTFAGNYAGPNYPANTGKFVKSLTPAGDTNIVGGGITTRRLSYFFIVSGVTLAGPAGTNTDSINLVATNRYLMSTFVFENNKNFFYYINDILITSGNANNTALSGISSSNPIFPSNSMVLLNFSFGGVQSSASGFGAEVNEVVFSDGEALSYNRVIKLYHYFKQKYQYPHRVPISKVFNGAYS
jgi:hypothetical protein